MKLEDKMALHAKCVLVLLIVSVYCEVSLGIFIRGRRTGSFYPPSRGHVDEVESLEDSLHSDEEPWITFNKARNEETTLTDVEAIAKLTDDVFDKDYKLSGINPIAPGESLSVALSFICVRFDEKENLLKSRVWEQLSWRDPQLKWNPSDYNGITDIRARPWYFWNPDLQVHNSVEADQRDRVNALVDSTGQVWYIPPATYTTVCRPDNSGNTHRCTIAYGSWTYDSVALPLKLEGTGVATDSYNEDCPYTISNPRASIVTKKYDCCENQYQSINITFTIQKNNYGYKFRD